MGFEKNLWIPPMSSRSEDNPEVSVAAWVLSEV